MPAINPDILIWARESAGFAVEEAARKLGFKDTKQATGAEKLLAFERGEVPSRALLVKMSKCYRQPLLTFYLAAAPRKGNRGNDYRTLPDGLPLTENALVDLLIRDLKARQSVVRTILVEEDEAEPVGFIGSITRQHGVRQVAELISSTIRFDLGAFRRIQGFEKAFAYLRNKVEAQGAFVLLASNLGTHHTDIDTRIFRGFAASDPIAPFIVINPLDSKAAWSFTLLHELAHLFLGESGVSGNYSEQEVEKFCNDVASEILLPADDFNNVVFNTADSEVLIQELGSFSKRFNISRKLLAYRLYRRGTIDQNCWMELNEHFKQDWQKFRAAQKEQNQEKEIKINPNVVRRHRLGTALLSLVQRMSESGMITPTRAGFVLGVKALKVHNMFDTSAAAA